jgi:ribonuclease VapC
VIVVDTSAVLAIAFNEPDADNFLTALDAAAGCLISAVSFAEPSIIIDRRRGEAMAADIELMIGVLGLEIEPVTASQARLASAAYRTYGKGNHPAALNFGDCFAYALAKATGLPLLFKGDDFARTDVLRLYR